MPGDDRVRALRGDGGITGAGRWHNPGRPIVYASSTPPLVMLEVLANVNAYPRLAPYFVMRVEIESESVETLGNADLPPDWNLPEWDQATQDYGSAFLASRRALALAVPSALLPLELRSEAQNLIVNPLHPEIGRVRVTDSYRLPFDPRLARWR